MKKITTDHAITRWDLFAESYANNHGDEGDLHKKVLLNPVIFQMIGSLQNKRLLDAGCGEGYLSRLLSEEGAIVTSVDFSERMIEIAKERTPEHMNIHYYHGNCEELNFLPDVSFDVIVSNMVMQDLANFNKACAEMYRLLVTGGMFVFSILHPCFITPNSDWERTPEGKKLYRKVGNYFAEGVYEQPYGEPENVYFFHRTLTTYINTLVDIGFRIDRIVEPTISKEMLAKHPEFADALISPNFIVFKLIK